MDLPTLKAMSLPDILDYKESLEAIGMIKKAQVADAKRSQKLNE